MTGSDDELAYLSIDEAGARLRRGEITSLALTEAHLARIGRLDAALGGYARVTAEAALRQARAADAELAAGRDRGPLQGVPLAVKDLFWTAGVVTAAGTRVHGDFRPAVDATVVQRLKAAGAVLLGKLQMTEGAYSDHHPSIRPPRNPWDPQAWPGISSSGPGVALAAGLCCGALASDTGGSIRWPCAANNLTGLKPTWGRVSRHGAFELAASLDHVGPMARDVGSVAAVLQAIAGRDDLDPSSLAEPAGDYLAALGEGAGGLRIGVDRRWNTVDVDLEVAAALAQAEAVFRTLGAEVVEVAAPDVAEAVADWPANCAVEAAVAHEATYPARAEAYGPVLASVIEAGRTLSGVDYQKILLRRMALRGRFDALFADVDLLLTPAHPFAPLTLERIRTLGELPALIARLQTYTCPFDMTGHPTLSLPAGAGAAGLPIGLQLVAGRLQEARLLAAGAAFQGASDWHRRRPDLAWAAGNLAA
ncbi:amidase [Phenylobacterium terrae]|uniref:Amidase n=1 Tax=Phenylobacterium terrae TaxID=2665495 RepID=A0ABW4MV60_9CAUL